MSQLMCLVIIVQACTPKTIHKAPQQYCLCIIYSLHNLFKMDKIMKGDFNVFKTSFQLYNVNGRLPVLFRGKPCTCVIMFSWFISLFCLINCACFFDRLYSVFRNLALSGISAPAGQLFHVQATLQILDRSAR